MSAPAFIAYARDVMASRKVDGIRGLGREWSRFRQHVATAEFAETPIDKITSQDIRAWQRWMTQKTAADHREERKLTRETINRSRALLSAVFAHAVDHDLITTNPCIGVKLRRRADESATKEKWAFFNQEEQQKLAACSAIPIADRLFIRFAIGTGMRQGELLSLMLDDLHVGEDPHVVVRFGARGLPPKSGKIRTVPLLPDALAAAREWLEILKARPNEEGLVFPSLRGKRRQQGKPLGDSKTFRRYCALAGVKGVRFHDLRHTCASSLIAGWWGKTWSLVQVRDMLGHSSVQITERYAHIGLTSLKQAARETVIVGEEPPANLSDTRSVLAEGAQQVRTYVWRQLRRVRDLRARVVAGVTRIAS